MRRSVELSKWTANACLSLSCFKVVFFFDLNHVEVNKGPRARARPKSIKFKGFRGARAHADPIRVGDPKGSGPVQNLLDVCSVHFELVR